VTLVLLHRDYHQDPGAFTRIRDQVFQSLRSQCDPLLLESAAFNIIEPHYMPVSVQLEVMAARPGERYSLQDLIIREIRRFLDPLTGNFNGHGWDIGEMPTKAQIFHYLKSAAGLLHIEKILAWTKDTDIDQIVRMPFALPVNGAHHAVVTIGG
jgi:hypothetical protein